jgi:hypothetical protein
MSFEQKQIAWTQVGAVAGIASVLLGLFSLVLEASGNEDGSQAVHTNYFVTTVAQPVISTPPSPTADTPPPSDNQAVPLSPVRQETELTQATGTRQRIAAGGFRPPPEPRRRAVPAVTDQRNTTLSTPHAVSAPQDKVSSAQRPPASDAAPSALEFKHVAR